MGKIIGLTGGIASGKTTVGQFFTKSGFTVVNADTVAHQVMAQPSLVKQIILTFGSDYQQSDGVLNRSKLAQLVFHHQDSLKRLNDVVQPAIKSQMQTEIKEAIASGAHCVVAEIPLLFEQHYESEVDAIIVVDIPEQLQLERLMARNDLSYEQAQQRVASQIERSKRLSGADYILDNQYDEAHLWAQFKQLCATPSFKKLCGTRKED